MRLAAPEGVEQPADDATVPVVEVVVTQPSMKPGTLPAIAVTWKLDSVSNIMA